MKGRMCMSEVETTTLRLIHSAAMQEFLEKDFKSASLRNIVKKAGVTTGAFYGYYASKESLFESLVYEQYEHFMGIFQKRSKIFPIFRRRSSQSIWATYPAHAWMKCFCMPTSI